MLDKNLPQKGDIVAAKYQIDGMLGTGGMGAVYRVTHRVTGKAFAIKWLLPKLSAQTDAVQRFIREAQVAGRVDHPNIVEVYDVGQEGETFFMVMELLHGESLAQRLAARGRLTPAQICQILIPVTHGLEAAHRAGVIHRDLKPDNIFLNRESEALETPKLLDFGISKMSELTGNTTPGITRKGAIMGTPYYMAPEQMRGERVDARTDVYALGVILYEALSGELPFTGDTFADLLLQVVSTEPKPLAALAPDVPAALVSVVERALTRDQSLRIESAAALGQLLEPFADAATSGGGTVAPHVSLSTETPLATSIQPAPPSAPPSAAHRNAPIRAGVALLATALGAAAWLMAARPELSREEAQHLLRPLPPRVAQPAPDEPLPTPRVTLIADAGLSAQPTPPPAAALVPEREPTAPPARARVSKRASKRSENPGVRDERGQARHAARSADVSVDDFLVAPARRER